MNRLVQRALNEAYRLYSRPAAIRRERARWTPVTDGPGSTPRVFYGSDSAATRQTVLSGGLVKCQDLQEHHPNTPRSPNLLYLVSSALPLHADVMARFARLAGARFVWNQNGVAYPAWHGYGWKQTNAPLARLQATADHVIYQSQFCQTAAERFLGPVAVPTEVLHNPVDTARFIPAQTPPPLEAPVLLVAGSHHAPYRVLRAIEILSLLAKPHPRATLTVAGHCLWQGGEQASRNEARRHAQRLGVGDRLLFTGGYTQEQAPALFQGAHLLLHAQYNDACPRLVVEAMACGLPVVFSATGGTPELVGPDAGIGVPGPLDWEHAHPPAATELATAVGLVLTRYMDFRRAARTRAETALSLVPWVTRHTAIFQQLLARQGRSS